MRSDSIVLFRIHASPYPSFLRSPPPVCFFLHSRPLSFVPPLSPAAPLLHMLISPRPPLAPPALRPAARALRQEVLQNQLASSPISSSDDEGGNGNFSFGGRNASPTRMGSVSPSRPRVSDVEEETEEPGEGEDEGTPSHRRRTMSVPVASPFTSTSTSTSTSPFAPRSSPFASRSNYANANANDGRESRSAESPSPTGGRFRNGRVRGMVRTFESSGSESGGEGSPERERERGGSGSGFRAANGNGSGFRAANGSGFRANGNGSGFRNANGASEEGDEDAIGGTVKPRALPVRPDGLGSLGDADVDLGATVRAWDHAYPNGKANAGYGNGTFVPAANGTPFGHATSSGGEEEELTVEELIAREDALLGGGGPQVQPNYTGGGGAWRTGRRGAGLEAQLTGGRLESGEYLTQQRTGGSSDSLMQQRTGGGGGRPLPAHPASSSSSSHPAHGMNRSGSGGVHAWEAEDGAVGATVKRVAASPAPSVSQAQGVKKVFGGAEADVNDDLARNRPTEAEARREQAKAEADAQERGRARGAAVRAQLAEAADLRALVDRFRVRLEEVERRVGEMEVAATATTSSAPTTGMQREHETPTLAPTQLTVSQRLDPRRLLALFASAPAAAQRTNGANANANGKREEWVGPTTLGALPSYVLLVGLGMCAVVLRVLVKRGLGAVRGRGAA
ncbi:hypothetical protein B0H13DRAFT_2669007 [Mycena leptocephala]|nr:hypothetical protein B0H13DRAFT_2669007 [Mycena leptocephala]